jgi:hypothetical protein
MQKPRLIEFVTVGSSDTGFMTMTENVEGLGFDISRVYWNYYTPQSVIRGGHAHFQLEQVLIAAAGTVTVTCESMEGEVSIFILDTPERGLYIPALCWHIIQFSPESVILSLASTPYNEADYIRDYQEFKKRLLLHERP